MSAFRSFVTGALNKRAENQEKSELKQEKYGQFVRDSMLRMSPLIAAEEAKAKKYSDDFELGMRASRGDQVLAQAYAKGQIGYADISKMRTYDMNPGTAGSVDPSAPSGGPGVGTPDPASATPPGAPTSGPGVGSVPPGAPPGPPGVTPTSVTSPTVPPPPATFGSTVPPTDAPRSGFLDGLTGTQSETRMNTAVYDEVADELGTTGDEIREAMSSILSGSYVFDSPDIEGFDNVGIYTPMSSTEAMDIMKTTMSQAFMDGPDAAAANAAAIAYIQSNGQDTAALGQMFAYGATQEEIENLRAQAQIRTQGEMTESQMFDKVANMTNQMFNGEWKQSAYGSGQYVLQADRTGAAQASALAQMNIQAALLKVPVDPSDPSKGFKSRYEINNSDIMEAVRTETERSDYAAHRNTDITGDVLSVQGDLVKMVDDGADLATILEAGRRLSLERGISNAQATAVAQFVKRLKEQADDLSRRGE